MATPIELHKLHLLLKETLDSTVDPKVKENLARAQELVNLVSIRSDGILKKLSLHGQVALVTGAGRGIGRCIAHALGEAGCKVAVVDINSTNVEIVAKELDSKGIASLPICVDVSNKEDVERMMEKVLDHFGDLHIGVNNAAIVYNSSAEETSEGDWGRILDVNLTGVFYCCQVEAKHMLKMKRGCIINTGSISGLSTIHPQKQCAYNASKAALIHMTKTLATEWADRGVRVNCFSPGYVDSDLIRTEALMPFRDQWYKQIPMGRLCNPEELVGGVLYLASSLASYTTGLNLVIDGGYLCW